METIIVGGIGTEVGKTVVSAILTTLFEGDYWKPIQSGAEDESDSRVIKTLIDEKKHRIYPPAYSFKAPLSPHHAAQLEGKKIEREKIFLPKRGKRLIVETVGGVLTPLSYRDHSLDLFGLWQGAWVLVSRTYLGSLNHTLLTMEAMKRRELPLLGVVFNGTPYPEGERAIMEIGKVPFLGRLNEEKRLDPVVIKRYAQKWEKQCYKNLLYLKKTAPSFGTPSPKRKEKLLHL